MIVLDEDQVEQPDPMIGAASTGHRVLLETTPARGRLARVQDLGRRARHGRHVSRCERGHARKPLQEIERHPFPSQDGMRGTGHRQQGGPGGDPVAVAAVTFPAKARVQ